MAIPEKSKSNFNQAVWLGFGQLSTALLSFVSAAILSRYFNKTDYGTYKQVLYIYSSLSSLFIIGLPSAFGYFLPRMKQTEQKSLINGINKIFLLSGALFSLILFFGAELIAHILKNPDLSLAIKVFSPFPLFTLPTLGVEGIYTALKKTKYVAFYSITSRLVSLIFIVTPVIFFGCGYIGAIIGWGIANFIIFIIAMYMKRRPYVDVQPEMIPNMYKAIFDYCLPLVGAFIAGFGISSASQFFISRYYGTAAFADFSNGNFSIPFVTMVAASIKGVLTPVISKAQHENNYPLIRQTYINACTNAILLIFPILIFVLYYAEPTMTFIYGEKYSDSASYMRMYILRDFCAALPYFAILMAFGKSKFYMNLHLIGVLFVWILDSVSVFLLKAKPYLLVFNDSLFHILCSIIVFLFILKKYGLNLFSADIYKSIIRVSVNCTIVGYISLYICKNICSEFSNNSFFLLLIGVFFYSILLLATSQIFGVSYIQVIRRFRKK